MPGDLARDDGEEVPAVAVEQAEDGRGLVLDGRRQLELEAVGAGALLEGRVVRVPRDQGEADVGGQLGVWEMMRCYFYG